MNPFTSFSTFICFIGYFCRRYNYRVSERELAEGVLNQNSYTMVKFNAMKTKPLRLLRQKRASWLKSVFVLTCLLLSTSVAMAQTKTVTGTVTSEEDGLPIVGASVTVKGTQLGTATDMDGHFTIANVPASAKSIVVFTLAFL